MGVTYMAMSAKEHDRLILLASDRKMIKRINVPEVYGITLEQIDSLANNRRIQAHEIEGKNGVWYKCDDIQNLFKPIIL